MWTYEILGRYSKTKIYVLLLSFQCSYLVLLYSYFLHMCIHCMYTVWIKFLNLESTQWNLFNRNSVWEISVVWCFVYAYACLCARSATPNADYGPIMQLINSIRFCTGLHIVKFLFRISEISTNTSTFHFLDHAYAKSISYHGRFQRTSSGVWHQHFQGFTIYLYHLRDEVNHRTMS